METQVPAWALGVAAIVYALTFGLPKVLPVISRFRAKRRADRLQAKAEADLAATGLIARLRADFEIERKLRLAAQEQEAALGRKVGDLEAQLARANKQIAQQNERIERLEIALGVQQEGTPALGILRPTASGEGDAL